MSSIGHQRSEGNLPKELCTALWSRVLSRLEKGEVLIADQHFQEALESDFEELTGVEASAAAKTKIRHMVTEVNKRHPETYVARGVRNAVSNAFDEGVRKLKWDVTKIESQGSNTVRRFTKLAGILDLLADANIDPKKIDFNNCVKDVLVKLAGNRQSDPAPDLAVTDVQLEAFKAQLRGIMGPDVADVSAVSAEADSAAAAAVASGEVSQQEAQQRTLQQEKRRSELEKQETEKVPQNVAAYVERGDLTKEEAEKVKALSDVERRLKKGEIDETEASRIRNSLLAGASRDELDKKVKAVVEHSVRFLQVFESMRRIGEQADPALKFLIRHKQVVVSKDGGGVNPLATLQELMDDSALLECLIDVMERKDHELRMVSVRLPPYNSVAGRGMERITNLTIEEDFVTDLRMSTLDDISDRLNSADALIRVRPAADTVCLINLIDHVTKRTWFRKELRMLRIAHSLEEFFRSTSDLKEARHQAENFLNVRVRRLFPDMSTDEGAEIKLRGAQMIDEIEQKILNERQEAVEEQRKNAKEAEKSKPAPSGAAAEDDLELSEDEKQLGVVIGRVEMRVAGNQRRIPYKIMPDQDDPTQHVVCQRDPDTGELVPQMKRGAKRIVEKGKDGVWRAP